jgi:hypothetical protein
VAAGRCPSGAPSDWGEKRSLLLICFTLGRPAAGSGRASVAMRDAGAPRPRICARIGAFIRKGKKWAACQRDTVVGRVAAHPGRRVAAADVALWGVVMGRDRGPSQRYRSGRGPVGREVATDDLVRPHFLPSNPACPMMTAPRGGIGDDGAPATNL